MRVRLFLYAIVQGKWFRAHTFSCFVDTPSSNRSIGRPTMQGNVSRGKLSPANPHFTNCEEPKSCQTGHKYTGEPKARICRTFCGWTRKSKPIRPEAYTNWVRRVWWKGNRDKYCAKCCVPNEVWQVLQSFREFFE